MYEKKSRRKLNHTIDFKFTERWTYRKYSFF